MKILIAYDGSRCSNIILEDLLRAGLPSQGEALVVSVLHPEEEAQPATIDEGKPLDEAVCDAVDVIRKSFPRWRVNAETPRGLPAVAILQRAHAWKPDLIIAGTHGRSPLQRVFLGSVALALVRGSECAIRVVRSRLSNSAEPIRLAVGHDGSLQAKACVREIAERNWPRGTQAVVVSALNPDDLDDGEAIGLESLAARIERTRRSLERTVKEAVDVLALAGILAHGTVVEGDPCRVLFDEAERLTADTIFVGARGLSRLEGLLLGSVSDRVVRQAHCSVEIVKRNRRNRTQVLSASVQRGVGYGDGS